ncbi:hypothetical protein [Streptomyces regalis]|uniref:hypothetical protein n=1 Tax=Streptomyces regalis TaxID=68262 RepID=UPI00131AEF43|nr:hypothetical protein [Streptomyces regalis]
MCAYVPGGARVALAVSEAAHPGLVIGFADPGVQQQSGAPPLGGFQRGAAAAQSGERRAAGSGIRAG